MDSLLSVVSRLEKELIISGKKDTALYFSDILSFLSNKHSANEMRGKLQEVQKAGSMVQYACFTQKEELLWNEVYAEVSKVLRTL